MGSMKYEVKMIAHEHVYVVTDEDFIFKCYCSFDTQVNVQYTEGIVV